MQDTPETRYQLALRLVQQIDENLSRGYYYRTKGGQIITTFDQVMVAIQQNEFLPLGLGFRGESSGVTLTCI